MSRMRRLVCCMLGHRLVELKRSRGKALALWECQDCQGRYVTSTSYPHVLLSSDVGWECFFQDAP